jgi:IS5 family transposase
VPEDKKQSNFTDPESRILGSPRSGFVQGYNGQIAVDGAHGVVVAARITQCAADNGELVPMTQAAMQNTKLKPEHVVADAGYRSEDGFAQLEELGVDAHVALGKGERQPTTSNNAGPATVRMQRKRRTKRSTRLYKRRKAIVEAPFGWIKSVMGFRTFSLRGLERVRGEWNLVCLALNLRRMARKLEWVG